MTLCALCHNLSSTESAQQRLPEATDDEWSNIQTEHVLVRTSEF